MMSDNGRPAFRRYDKTLPEQVNGRPQIQISSLLCIIDYTTRRTAALLTLSARKLTKMFSLIFRNYTCVVTTKCGSYKH